MARIYTGPALKSKIAIACWAFLIILLLTTGLYGALVWVETTQLDTASRAYTSDTYFTDIASGADTTAGYVYILRGDGAVYFTDRGTNYLGPYLMTAAPTAADAKYVAISAGAGATAGYVYLLRSDGAVYFASRGVSTWTAYSPSSSALPSSDHEYVDIASGAGTTAGYLYALREDGSVYFIHRGTANWTKYLTTDPPQTSGTTYVGIAAGEGTTAGYVYLLRNDGEVYFASRGVSTWTLYRAGSDGPPSADDYIAITTGAGTTAGYIYAARGNGNVYFTSRGTSGWTLYRAAGTPPPASTEYIGLTGGAGTTGGYLYLLHTDSSVYFIDRGTGNWIFYTSLEVRVPGAPINFAAIAGDGTVNLTWAAPVQTGGAAIEHFRLYRSTASDDPVFLLELGNVTDHTDTGLTNGVTYYYWLSAVNSVGEGAISDGITATPFATATVPTAPRNLAAYAGNQQIVLTWDSPLSDGGAAITNYRIYRGTAANSETFLIEVGNVTTYTDTGLTNGQEYYYKVSAKNSEGEGGKSNEASATPTAATTVPTPPLNLVGLAGNKQVILSWSAPGSDGGAAITHYRIYRGTAANSESFLMEVGNVRQYIDTGLTNGLTYYYRISAKNSVGEGGKSNEASATPTAAVTQPSMPRSLTATAGDQKVTLSWLAPSSDGGAQIVGYTIYRSEATRAEELTVLTTIGNVLTYTDTGLKNGFRYYYQVSAVNSAGESNRSNEVSVRPMWSAIDHVTVEPSSFIVESGEAFPDIVARAWADEAGVDEIPIELTYSWRLAPTALGTLNSTTTREVTFLSGSSAMEGELVAEITYRGVKKAGSANVKVSATPVVLNSVTISPLNVTLRVDETEALTAHGWFEGYELSGVAFNWSLEPGSLGTLTPATGKVVTLTAEHAGTGMITVHGEYRGAQRSNSTPLEVIVLTVPSTPVNVSVSGGDGKVILQWVPPTDDGGRAIENYRVYRGLSSGSLEFLAELGPSVTFVDTTVSNGVTYFYQITAVNQIGESQRSVIVHAIPAAPALPDLAISSGDLTLSNPKPSPGEYVTITASVHNIGTAEATSIRYLFYLDNAPIETIKTIERIEKGASTQVSIQWLAVKGEHTLSVTVDLYNFIDELNEKNNNATVTITVEQETTTGEGEGEGVKGAFGLQSWAWWIIIAIIIIVIVVLVLVLWRRKPKKEPLPPLKPYYHEQEPGYPDYYQHPLPTHYPDQPPMPEPIPPYGAPAGAHYQEPPGTGRTCPYCGAGIQPEWRACVTCGARLPEPEPEAETEIEAEAELEAFAEGEVGRYPESRLLEQTPSWEPVISPSSFSPPVEEAEGSEEEMEPGPGPERKDIPLKHPKGLRKPSKEAQYEDWKKEIELEDEWDEDMDIDADIDADEYWDEPWEETWDEEGDDQAWPDKADDQSED